VNTQSNRYWVAENHFISHYDVKVCCTLSMKRIIGCVFMYRQLIMIDVGQILQPFLKQLTDEEKLYTLAKGFLQLCIC
jgi:hypothetical protein